VLTGATALVVAAAVMMGTARGPLAAALRGLRAPDRQPHQPEARPTGGAR
jgi:putative peptidoglycan lipid II flippase